MIDAARVAEAAGFDGVYVGDHLVHPRPLLESVVTVSAVAASTAHVALGFCVLLVALRPTVLLAQQLATLAAFAPGRLRIGVGVGGEIPAGVRDRRASRSRSGAAGPRPRCGRCGRSWRAGRRQSKEPTEPRSR